MCLLLALTTMPALLGAQQAVSAAPPAADVAQSAMHRETNVPMQRSEVRAESGPRIAPVGLQVDRTTSLPATLPSPRDPGANVGPNLALMGVGAAAVVVGLLIGNDGGNAVAVGGAVIGLIGLYRYMR